MRSGAAAGATGYFHELALYGSDRELVDIAVPFIEDGLAAGEPTLVTLNERNATLVRERLRHPDGPEFLPATRQYARPAQTIASYRRLLGGYVAGGADQIRVVGDVPHPGTGGDWSAWSRYEAAVNQVLDDFPLWGLCPYDLRVTPEHVVADVERLHPHVVLPDGTRRANDRFLDPSAHLAWGSELDPLPEQDMAPAVAVGHVGTPAIARRSLVEAAASARLDDETLDALVTSASEVVTNALVYGGPPVSLQVWAGDSAVVCSVRDPGRGPADPFAGLVPAPLGDEGGYGLWIANHLCDRVDIAVDDEGCTVRLLVRADDSGS